MKKLVSMGVLAALALTAVACGSDDDGGGAGSTPQISESSVSTASSVVSTTAEPSSSAPDATETLETSGSTVDSPPTAVAADPLGTPNAASGDAVKVGFINLEGGAAISLPEIRDGVEATVGYANDYLGGLAGRPIELVQCKTDGTPESSTACANKVVGDGVVAIVLGQDASPAQVVKVAAAAGIPYLVMSANTLEEFTTPGVFALNAGVVAALAAEALWAGQHGFKQYDLVVLDVPAVTTAVQALGGPLFESQNVTLNIVAAAPGTADMTPQLSSMDSADVIGVIGDANLCIAFLKGADSLGLDKPKLIYGSCNSQQVVDAVSASAWDNTYEPLPLDVNPGPDNDDAVTYRAVIDKYVASGGAPDAYITAQGYVAVLTLVAALKGTTGDITPAAVAAALSAIKNVPLPLSHGIPLTCDSKQVTVALTVCSNQTMMFKMTPQGRGEFVETLDLAPLLVSS